MTKMDFSHCSIRTLHNRHAVDDGSTVDYHTPRYYTTLLGIKRVGYYGWYMEQSKGILAAIELNSVRLCKKKQTF